MSSSFEVSHDVETVQVRQLMELWASAWWAAGRTEGETHRMLAGSDVVAPGLRGSGVGATLMDAILRHPRVAGVKSIELVCQPGLMPFYRRWGFTDQVGQSRLMRRTDDPSLVAKS